MKKIKMNKTHILVAVYVALIIIELFFFVPYHSIQIFRTQQYTPYIEIVGSGYASMEHINRNEVDSWKNGYTSNVGKRVNTPQLFINVSITTVLAIAIYFIQHKKEKVKQLPLLDVNALAFADEDAIAQAQRDYAKEIYEYVKGKEKLK